MAHDKSHPLDSTTDHGAASDNTDLNVSTSAHGLCPKLSNVVTEFLNGQGAFSVPAGGGSGGFTWVQKTANYTAVDSDGILIDTVTTGAFTITLPATPSTGDAVAFLDAASNCGTDYLTIARNGEDIQGEASDLIIDVNDAAFCLVFDATYGWRLYPWQLTGAGAGDGYVKVSDVKAANTAGQSLTSGAWRTRDLTTEDADSEDLATLAANQITLQPGTYICNLSAPVVAAGDRHKLKLRNITTGADTIVGTSEYRPNTSGSSGQTRSFVNGRFTINVATVFEVQHRVNANCSGGVACNFGVSEVYTIAEFWRVASSSVAPAADADYIKVSDVRSSGTNGGDFNSGAWRTRTLQTEDSDTGGDASLSANQITLQPGTYVCKAEVIATDMNRHQARLQNITDGTTELLGLVYEDSGSGVSKAASVVGRFTISTAKVFEFQHRCSVTKATIGFGQAASFGDEVYATVEFWKVA